MPGREEDTAKLDLSPWDDGLPQDGIPNNVRRVVGASHGMTMMLPDFCNTKHGLPRDECNFSVPLGVPYKYSVGGSVVDDELMAIYSYIYYHSI